MSLDKNISYYVFIHVNYCCFLNTAAILQVSVQYVAVYVCVLFEGEVWMKH